MGFFDKIFKREDEGGQFFASNSRLAGAQIASHEIENNDVCAHLYFHLVDGRTVGIRIPPLKYEEDQEYISVSQDAPMFFKTNGPNDSLTEDDVCDFLEIVCFYTQRNNLNFDFS